MKIAVVAGLSVGLLIPSIGHTDAWDWNDPQAAEQAEAAPSASYIIENTHYNCVGKDGNFLVLSFFDAQCKVVEFTIFVPNAECVKPNLHKGQPVERCKPQD